MFPSRNQCLCFRFRCSQTFLISPYTRLDLMRGKCCQKPYSGPEYLRPLSGTCKQKFNEFLLTKGQIAYLLVLLMWLPDLWRNPHISRSEWISTCWLVWDVKMSPYHLLWHLCPPYATFCPLLCPPSHITPMSPMNVFSYAPCPLIWLCRVPPFLAKAPYQSQIVYSQTLFCICFCPYLMRVT